MMLKVPKLSCIDWLLISNINHLIDIGFLLIINFIDWSDRALYDILVQLL